MFQGMFRKRGRPPEPPLQIGGYDEPIQDESIQIPGHQLRDAPRQLPLPAVREFDQVEIAEQEQPGFNQAIVESSSLQQQQIDVDMLDSHNQRLIPSPRQPVPKCGGRFLQNGRTELFRAKYHKIKHFVEFRFQDNKEGNGLI